MSLQTKQGVNWCPNCGSQFCQPTTSKEGLAFRCHSCNVRFCVSNPSYMNKSIKPWFADGRNRAKTTD